MKLLMATVCKSSRKCRRFSWNDFSAPAGYYLSSPIALLWYSSIFPPNYAAHHSSGLLSHNFVLNYLVEFLDWVQSRTPGKPFYYFNAIDFTEPKC